jgi:hypothetical protein
VALPVDVVGNPVSGKTATWASANSSIATVSSTGLVTGVQIGSTTMSATVDGYSAASTVTVTSAAPTDITAVSITGQSSVRSGQVCTWFAAVTGGVAPLSYVWKRGGTVVGNSSSIDLSTSTSFSLTLTATERTEARSRQRNRFQCQAARSHARSSLRPRSRHADIRVTSR